MSRYLFIFHECDGTITEDEKGRYFDDPDDIRPAAIEMARSIMAAEVSRGRLCLSCWIVVADERNHNVLTLHFGEAVHMVEHPACPSEAIQTAAAE